MVKTFGCLKPNQNSPATKTSHILDTQPASMLNPQTSGKRRTFIESSQGPREWLSERPCLITVTVETTELSLPSRIETVAEAAAAVAEFVSRSGISDDAAFGIDMAVREAVTNAVIHGNSEDEDKLVDIILKSSPESLEISVHDQGTGFNPNEVPDPTAEENILKTSGRGIFFMRNFFG